MPTIEKICFGLLPILLLMALPLVDGDRAAHAENPELSTAVFYVQ